MDLTVVERAAWVIDPLPGGVRLWHAECRQYRSFTFGESAAAISEALTGHTCPPPALFPAGTAA